MSVSVVHLSADGRLLAAEIELAPGLQLIDAVHRSGLPRAVRELAVAGRVGVFGHLRPLDWPLQDGDRVEIYRPLAIDPKQRRRQRAQLEIARAPRRR